MDHKMEPPHLNQKKTRSLKPLSLTNPRNLIRADQRRPAMLVMMHQKMRKLQLSEVELDLILEQVIFESLDKVDQVSYKIKKSWEIKEKNACLIHNFKSH